MEYQEKMMHETVKWWQIIGFLIAKKKIFCDFSLVWVEKMCLFTWVSFPAKISKVEETGHIAAYLERGQAERQMATYLYLKLLVVPKLCFYFQYNSDNLASLRFQSLA